MFTMSGSSLAIITVREQLYREKRASERAKPPREQREVEAARKRENRLEQPVDPSREQNSRASRNPEGTDFRSEQSSLENKKLSEQRKKRTAG
jgi:hypothetical protein